MNLFSAASFILLVYSPAVLADGACTARSDCGIGGVCALSEVDLSAGLVCCTSGNSRVISTLPYPNWYVCTGLAVGMKCGGENYVCASGVCGMDNLCKQEPIEDESPCENRVQCASGACARSEADASAGHVCCASGDSTYVYRLPPYPNWNVCTGLAVGMKCGEENRVCASGVCDMDNLCKQEPIEDESPCRNSGQCASGACGRSEADANAGLVCCTSGGTAWVSSIGGVCTGLAVGMKCGEENDVCASGVCGMDNLCKQEPIGDESPCSNNDQCASGACGRSEADTSAGHVCCTSGGVKQVSTLSDDWNRDVCTGLAVGMKCGGTNLVCASGVCGMDNLCKACFDDSICESNVCVSGVCQVGKKWGNEPCEKDTHCHSGQCKSRDSDGLGSCQPFASLAAKNDYINDSADCPLDPLVPPDASDASSVSVSVGLWQLAEHYFMFGQEVLVGVDKCLGSFAAQRQGNQVCFSYQRIDKFSDGSSTFTCVTKCTKECRYDCRNQFSKVWNSFWDSNEYCVVTVNFEADAQADSNNGGYETLFGDGDMSSLEDILNMNGIDPDVYEDIIEDALDDPDASVNTILNALGLGNSSARVITSAGISLFTAASIAFLFW